MCPVTCSRKLCLLLNNVKKFCTAGQATHDNMAHAHGMLDNEGYRHTLRICNTYCFSTAKFVARTCLNVTSHAHCLPVAAVVNSSLTGDVQTRIAKLLYSRYRNYKPSEDRTTARGTHCIHISNIVIIIIIIIIYLSWSWATC